MHKYPRGIAFESTIKYMQDDRIIISVRKFDELDYVWQYCKGGTVDWDNIEKAKDRILIINEASKCRIDDRYRCLVYKSGELLYFTPAFAVGLSKTITIATLERQNDSNAVSIDNMDGLSFEVFCAELLKKNGFNNVSVTRGSGDYGIDILAEKEGITYGIQCKHYSSTVGNKSVQEAYSGKAYYNCMVGVVLTNNYFTEQAKETAKRNNIILWDRDYLNELIEKAKQ